MIVKSVLLRASADAKVAVHSLCCLLACALLVTAIGCGSSKPKVMPIPPPEAEDIKELISQLAKKRKVGMVEDIRLPSAKRLGDAGPAAKDAIPALEKMAADKDPKVKEAANEALKRIKGG